MISITNKQNCTGCSACSSVCPVAAIAMEPDSEGFWYPIVDHDKCTRCGKCTSVCPIMGTATRGYVERPVPEAYAACCSDEELRLNSSSGGLFSLLAKMVINSGGVVFGARFDEDFSVIHDYVEETEHLCELRGSKYVQSRIGDTFGQAQELLESGRLVMFTGTPCQIGGLKGYLGREYDHLICQDIICHGVPSPKVWHKYVNYQESCAASAIEKIAFRRKDKGWRQFSMSFLFENNAEYIRSLHDDLYMKAFLADLCLRPSCHACRFKDIHRESDITLADFWGVQHLVPTMDDDKGTSLVVLHTQKGYEWFNKVQHEAKVYPVNLEEAIRYNSAMTSSVKPHPDRATFFLDVDSSGIDILIKKHCRDKLYVRLKKRLAFETRHVLKRLGLLNKANKLLPRR